MRRRPRLFTPTTRPSPAVRAAFFVSGLVALAATYMGTGSVELQALVMFGLIFLVLPLLEERFGATEDEHYFETIRQRHVPAGVLAVAFAFLIVWGALTALAVPDDLGGFFWLWLVTWPWSEVLVYLGRRRLKKDGAAAWKPIKPLRDAALAGVAVIPMIVIVLLLADQTGAVETILTSLGCGVAVFLISLAIARPSREGGSRFR